MDRPAKLLWSQSILMLAMAGCGDDNDSIWTGLSGVIIFGIIAIIVIHYLRKD